MYFNNIQYGHSGITYLKANNTRIVFYLDLLLEGGQTLLKDTALKDSSWVQAALDSMALAVQVMVIHSLQPIIVGK